MNREPGVLIDPTQTGSSAAFLEALKKSLSDLYNKDKGTNIHKLFSTLATQLANVDVETERLFYDLFLQLTKDDERITRGYSATDLLEEQNAFAINYIGFVPSGTLYTQLMSLSLADTAIILERIPDMTAAVTLTLDGTDYSSLVRSYDATTNSLILTAPTVAGVYSLVYTDAGCTLYSNESIAVTDGVATLANTPIIYDSERIVIHNSAVGVLQRGIDYTIDYFTGVVTAIAGGLITVLEPERLDVSYRYKFDFDKYTAPKFFEQVFNELTTITGTNTVSVVNPDISEVFRLYNTTTRETYTPTSISRGSITFNYQVPITLRTKTGELTTSTIVSVTKDRVQYVNTYVADESTGQYPVQALNKVYASSKPIRLVLANRQIVPNIVNLEVPLETQGISLKTGGVDSYHSHVELLPTTDYTFTITHKQLQIVFSEKGKIKVGSNSLYLSLLVSLSAFETSSSRSEQTVTFTCNTVQTCSTEQATFEKEIVLLSKGLYYIEPTTNGDNPLGEAITVLDDTGTILVNNKDYLYDPINKTLALIAGSSLVLGDLVTVIYRGQLPVYIDYTFTPDKIVCDYSHTKNSIDWTPSLKVFDIEIPVSFGPSNNIVQLVYHPLDIENFSEVSIYNVNDRTDKLQVNSYDPNERILYVDQPSVAGDYIVEYVGAQHKVDPTVPYFVSYLFGARDSALRHGFAPLLGLKDTRRRRYEEKVLIGNQTEIVLEFPPLDIDNIAIFAVGDIETNTVATVLSLKDDGETIITTPIRGYGAYTVAYDTPNALTEDLRKLIIGLMQAFLTGPTVAGIQQLVEVFTGITPNVQKLSDLGFVLRDEDIVDPDQQSGRLNNVLFTGENVEFVPARFNVGFQSSLENKSVLYGHAVTNVQAKQGTFQLLIGPHFQGDTNQTYYFLDIGKKDQFFRNRISLYKNERGYLVFEIHDDSSKVWRCVSPVGLKKEVFTQFLTAGTSQIILPKRPTFSTTDIDNNGEFDLFEAQPTEFVIRRVYNTTEAEAQGEFPLQIAIHFQIKDDPEYGTLAGFNRATQRLYAVMNQVEAGNGQLVVHVSPTYITACSTHANILEAIIARGHEVGLYLDVPSYITDQTLQIAYVQEALTAATQLGVTIQSFSSNYELRDWQALADAVGLQIATGYVDPLTARGLEDPSPKVRRVTGTPVPMTVDTPPGQIAYLPGAADLNFNRPVTNVTLQQIESTLHRALTFNQNVVGQVSSWYPTFEVEDFTDNYVAEAQLIGIWLKQSVAPLVALQKVQWNRFIDCFAIFRTLENLIQQDAATTNLLNRQEKIRPLKYNWDTGVLTFEPVPFDGVYEFNYLTGWSAYEESEIFLCATYKLHTEDGSLPYYKLYINGELQDFTTFADFPII